MPTSRRASGSPRRPVIRDRRGARAGVGSPNQRSSPASGAAIPRRTAAAWISRRRAGRRPRRTRRHGPRGRLREARAPRRRSCRLRRRSACATPRQLERDRHADRYVASARVTSARERASRSIDCARRSGASARSAALGGRDDVERRARRRDARRRPAPEREARADARATFGGSPVPRRCA